MEQTFEIFRHAFNSAMDSQSVSQTDMARQLGCSISKVHSLRTGARKPYESDSRRIAAILGFASYESFLDVGRAKLGLPTVASRKDAPLNPSDEMLIAEIRATLAAGGDAAEKLRTFLKFKP